MSLAQAVTDNVVKRWLLRVWVHKDHLLLGERVVKLNMLLTEVLEVLNRDVVQRNSRPALCISVYSVVHQK